jgi:2-dehydropantoate 2-reductase
MSTASSGRLRIAFVGAGAIGGYVGGHLAKAGLDVVLIDQWAEHVEAMQRHGLRFSGTLGEYTVPVRALHVSDAQSLVREPIDLAFVCVKLYDTAWATTLVKDYLAPDGCVVTMQNSVVEPLVAGIVGWGRTLGCIASTMSAEAYAPGRIVRTRQPGGAAYTIFRAGETHGRVTPRLTQLVELLGLVDSAKATTNLWGERWSKLVANTMTTGVSGVTGMSLMDVVKDASMRPLLVRLAAEAIRVGQGHGYAIEPVRRLEPEVWLEAERGGRAALAQVERAFAVELERMTDAGYSGTAQDLRKGRRTEIDYMNGYVARQGQDIGIAAPTHAALTALVHRMERGELAPHPDSISSLM